MMRDKNGKFAGRYTDPKITPYTSELGQFLKHARETAGYTQAEMAAAVNVDVRYYQTFERGRDIGKIAKFFECLEAAGCRIRPPTGPNLKRNPLRDYDPNRGKPEFRLAAHVNRRPIGR